MQNILIFGDSIVAGKEISKNYCWVNLLINELDKQNIENLLVYNLGVPGESSVEILKRMPAECQTRISQPFIENNIIILSLGVNDSKGLNNPDNFNIPLDIFRSNITNLINTAHKYTKKVLCIGPIPVDESKTSNIPGVYFLNSNIHTYNNTFKDCATACNVPYIDLFNDWLSNNNSSALFGEDGIHPNKQGHQKIYTTIQKTFHKLLHQKNTLE